MSALAQSYTVTNIEITIDAEEQHRLSISLDLIETLALHKNFKDWGEPGWQFKRMVAGAKCFHFAKNLAY